MGDHASNINARHKEKLHFTNAVIHDIEALEWMIAAGMIESDVQRIGAEQELCIVNEEWLPNTNNLALLEKINDPAFTTELAKYNIELNCSPLLLQDGCFCTMQQQLQLKYFAAQDAAENLSSRIILTGILPTISRKETALDYLTPLPRYHYLNSELRKKRGRNFDLFMKGVDELHVRHDNIMFEACNTSFQLHLQIRPAEMVAAYNWAQAISAPVLAVATNSPMLFGKELWSEIRIALFQQSIETRKSVEEIRNLQPRVTFGKDWIRNSFTDIYKEDISRFDVILTRPDIENAFEKLQNGGIPELNALRLHNGTVYRWNRPCYGISDGVAHLRIENRYLPAGPSIEDEVANMAFWVGLMEGRPEEADNIWEHYQFRDIKSNFFKAARSGIETVLIWKNKEYTVKELIREELLPIAYKGLQKCGISEKEIALYLGNIEKRLHSSTGAQWQIKNFRKLRETLSPSDASIAITAAMYENQMRNKPVSTWGDIEKSKATRYLVNHFTDVKQLMSTDLITVFPEDPIFYVKKIMQWYTINHMMIENRKGALVGIITSGKIQELEAAGIDTETTPVRNYMKKVIHTAEQDTKIEAALQMMQELHITSLPAVKDDKLVGIVTRNDMLRWLNFKEG